MGKPKACSSALKAGTSSRDGHGFCGGQARFIEQALGNILVECIGGTWNTTTCQRYSRNLSQALHRTIFPMKAMQNRKYDIYFVRLVWSAGIRNHDGTPTAARNKAKLCAA